MPRFRLLLTFSLALIVACYPFPTTSPIPETPTGPPGITATRIPPVTSTQTTAPNQSQIPTATHEVQETATLSPLGSSDNPIIIDTSLQGGVPYLPFADNAYWGLNSLLLPAIYAELVRLDADGEYFPYLAASLPTLDNDLVRFIGEGEDQQLEVEFQLRPGILWQDGEPLTTEDLVFSWELVMQPDWPGYHWSAPELFVNSVEALATDRVSYRFMSQAQARQAAKDGWLLGDPTLYTSIAQQEGPVAPLNYLEVGRNVFPRHLLEDIDVKKISESDFAQNPIFARAYRLVEGGRYGEPVVLEAFEDFVLGKPDIARVIFGAIYSFEGAEPYFQTPDVLADALRDGAVQAQLGLRAIRTRDEGIEPHSYDVLAEEGLARVIWTPRDSWETLDFNLDNPHLADLKVRQAIAVAIDRQAIIDLALGGHGELMRSYLPGWHPLYAGDDSLPEYSYDVAGAKALLQDAGYDINQFPAVHAPRGPLVLELASMDVTTYPRQGTAELIREQLSEIGIQLEVQFYEWPEFEGEDCSAIRNGRHFDLGMAGWLGIDLNISGFAERITASWNIPSPENGCPIIKSNWSGWRNDRVDEIIPQLKDGRLALENPEMYQQLWIDHQVLWAKELPSLPLFNSQRPVVVVPELVGVQPSPFDISGVEDTWNIYEWVINK